MAKLPRSSGIYNVTSQIIKLFYHNRKKSDECFILKHVSEDFVFKELCSLNITKSTGLDGIPARFLKDAAPVLKIPITFLINKSISEGVVPDELKLAKVKPLFKKNDRLRPENYRPVSILSIVSKILEKSVYIQLEKFLKSNNILYEFQSGFRTSFSTDSCLIHLIDHVKSQTARGLFTGMVLLDLQKAFDTVDHEIMCQKLEVIGVQSISWFQSYLTSRRQLVNVNGVNSDMSEVVCGVPQGSLLGPLLFLIYVNDVTTSIDSNCKVLLYADDTAILFSHKDPCFISKKLSDMLESCHEWLVDNKLSLHLGKTESIIFGPKRKLNKIGPEDFNISCNGIKIEAQSSVKYLGIMIDQFLSGELIVTNIIKKVNQRLKFLYRYKQCLDLQSRKTLCSTLIQCHIDYACSCWYEGLTMKMKNQLQVAQNKVVRFILGLHNRSRIGYNEFEKLGFLNVANRVKQLRLNHVFNIYNNKCPEYMHNNFVKISSNYNTRSSQMNFFVPSVKGCESSTFYFNGIKDWNILPNSTKMCKNKHSFKSSVKQFLLDKLRSVSENIYVYY